MSSAQRQEVVRHLPSTLMRMGCNKPILLAFSIVGAVSGCWWAVKDYRQWKALGRGGTSSDLFGWLKVSLVTLIARSQRRITDTADLDGVVKQIINQEGEIAVFRGLHLLERQGSRPEVRGVIPQRQVEHYASKVLTDELNAYMIWLASNYPTQLHILPSAWEGHVDALFLRQSPAATSRSASLSSRMLANVAPRLEIAHMHTIDGSLHISLSPADAAEIIRKGWGVRHRLSGRFLVPSTFVMVYAPRNAAEVAVVKKMIAATVEYATGLSNVA